MKGKRAGPGESRPGAERGETGRGGARRSRPACNTTRMETVNLKKTPHHVVKTESGWWMQPVCAEKFAFQRPWR